MVNIEKKTPSTTLNKDINDWLLNPWANFLSSSNRDMSNFFEPAIDLKEKDDCYILVADIPGVDPKKIEINIENNILTISGTKEENYKEENTTYTKIERMSGKFCRSCRLPSSINMNKIKANAENGVLRITLPKQESSKPKRIQVE